MIDTKQAMIDAVDGYLSFLHDKSQRLGTEEFRQHQFRIVSIACCLVEKWQRDDKLQASLDAARQVKRDRERAQELEG